MYTDVPAAVPLGDKCVGCRSFPFSSKAGGSPAAAARGGYRPERPPPRISTVVYMAHSGLSPSSIQSDAAVKKGTQERVSSLGTSQWAYRTRGGVARGRTLHSRIVTEFRRQQTPLLASGRFHRGREGMETLEYKLLMRSTGVHCCKYMAHGTPTPRSPTDSARLPRGHPSSRMRALATLRRGTLVAHIAKSVHNLCGQGGAGHVAMTPDLSVSGVRRHFHCQWRICCFPEDCWQHKFVPKATPCALRFKITGAFWSV